MASVEQYKEDIATKYLDQFKSELNFFEKAMILPITGKMKEILKSDKKIDAQKLSDLEDLWFRRKVLWAKFWDKVLFESLVNKTFNFLKQQQEKIIEAQTQWKLDVLLNEAINWKLEDLNQTVAQASDEQQQSQQAQSQQVQDQQWEQAQQGQTEQQSWNQESLTWNEDRDWWFSMNDHAVEAGIWSAAVATGAYRQSISQVESRLWLTPKQLPESFDKARTQEMFWKLADQMEEKLNWWAKLNRLQRYTYQKSIANFREASKSLDNATADAYKAWQKIWDRLPPQFLKHLNIDHHVLDLIDALPEKELKSLIWKNEKQIVNILKRKGIQISEDFAKSLKIATNVQEIKQITNVARNGRKLASFLKGVKGMWVITFLFMWFDVWNYFDASKEAELVSKLNSIRWQVLQDEATAQLIIWVWWVLAEALWLFCVCAAGWSVGWPIGTALWVCIGVIVWAISMITSSYHASKEFYSQNRHDFINKKRAEVKQSIVQLFESDRLGMDEGMKESIKEARGPNSEVNTMEDAWEALIYQEEISEGWYDYLSWYYGSWETEENFLNKLSQQEKDEYQREKEKMEQVINIRMEYIKQHISDNHSSESYKALKEAINNNKWIAYVEQILADAKIYSYLKSEDENPYIENYKTLDIKGYKEAYRNKLQSEYSEQFAIFEKLKTENPILLDEICRGAKASKPALTSYIESSQQGTESETTLYSPSEIEKLKKNLDFVEKYDHYRKLWVSQEQITEAWISETWLDYNYIEQVLLDLNSLSKRPKREKEKSMKYLSSAEYNTRIDDREVETSKSLFQNILYSIAKEVHGYTGKNDKQELVGFYALSWDVTWIYMNGKWKVNEDWEVDWTIDSPDIMTKEEMLKVIVWEVELDTSVEAADEKVTQEVRERIKEIIEREFSFREKKKEYEEKIVDYIKSQWWSGYMELPNDLIIQARKSWIGEIDKFLFTYENWKIKALWRWDTAGKVLNFDKTGTEITYEVTNKLRESYTQEEERLMKKVDEMKEKLTKMRALEGDALWWGTKEDALDIPVEIERLMSKKSAEWQDAKDAILYMQPYTAQDFLSKKAKEYYEYFEGMYVGLLSEITRKSSFLNSDDIDEVDEFMQASSFVWVNIVNIEKWELKLATAVDEKVWEYLLKLLELYKDEATGKTVKEMLLSEDSALQEKWQELAKGLHMLCLEESVIKRDSEWNISSYTTLDMNDSDFERVKTKMKDVLSQKQFQEIHNEYQNAAVAQVWEVKSRRMEWWEQKVHQEINKITDNIINTMNHIDWAHMRNNPKFVPDQEQLKEGEVSWTFDSRWFKEKVTLIIEWDKILWLKINWLDIVYWKDPESHNSLFWNMSESSIHDSIEEWLRTANLINFIKDNAKKNPYWKSAVGRSWGTYWYYHRSNGWDLERDVVNNMNDFNILESDTVEKYYYMIKDNEDFIHYINSFV